MVKTLSLLIPVYNEVGLIQRVLARLDAVPFPGWEREYILIDDGSTDGTGALLDQLASHYSAFRVIHLPFNQGKGASIQVGARFAKGEAILIQDGDFEYNPADIPLLLAAYDKGNRVVYGSRFWGKGQFASFIQWGGNRSLTYLCNMLYGTTLTDMETGYKLIATPLFRTLRLRSKGFAIEPEITARLALRKVPIIEVPISYHARIKGKKIRFVKDGIDSLLMLLRLKWGLL
jgi:glycosyltransferase involved in cell wall biosynthesis